MGPNAPGRGTPTRAAVVHIHVRDESGAPAHRRDLYERAIAPIRERAPELMVGK